MEDSMIIDLYWQRDESAIVETDIKYHPYCQTISYRILNNEEDAEECVNDTWLRTWNRIPPERPQIFSAFLGKITRNLSIDRYRKNHAAKRGADLEVVDLELNECVDRNSLDEHLDDKMIAEVISRFLQERDEFSRVLFMRRYWYLESISDMAERFGVSESKVKSNLFRTRKALKACLLQEGVCL